jgi:hypothetical protein
MDRRSLLGGALAACISARAHADEGYGSVAPGVETWSESLMLLHFDHDLRNGISVRLSRYPDLNVTWVWCHVLFDGKMYAYTERRLPCLSSRNLGEAAVADYASEAAGVVISRRGPVSRLEDIRLKARVTARQSSEGADGPGDTPIAIDAVFRPARLKDNLPAGRSEWTGAAEVEISLGDRRVRLAGIAKAHEQTQTAPRFDGPFTYAMLWNDTASFIGTSAARRRNGDLEIDGVSRAVTDFRPAAPGAERTFELVLADGALIQGRATRVARYDVPIFGRMWNGAIVRAEVAGRPMIGMVNDWRPEDRTFP